MGMKVTPYFLGWMVSAHFTGRIVNFYHGWQPQGKKSLAMPGPSRVVKTLN